MSIFTLCALVEENQLKPEITGGRPLRGLGLLLDRPAITTGLPPTAGFDPKSLDKLVNITHTSTTLPSPNDNFPHDSLYDFLQSLPPGQPRRSKVSSSVLATEGRASRPPVLQAIALLQSAVSICY